MNIIQVAPRYPPHTGGVETHVKELSERLVARGHSVTVLTAGAGEAVTSREIRGGVEVIRHRGFSPSGSFHIAPGILRTLRSREPDVVHAHNYHAVPLLFAAVDDIFSRSRLVVTPHYHGASASSFRDRLLSVYRPFGRASLARADAIIAVSNWERDLLEADFGVQPTVIPNGIDVERFQNAEPLRRSRPYLLSVGRLEQYKGIQHLIRALPNLSQYELLIVGCGPYRDELARIPPELGVANRVSFLGFVDESELPGIYAGAEAYVTMSSFEAYGMTVAESLAAGTPCVVREEGALTEWKSHKGCLGVTGTSPASIAETVKKVVGRKTRPEELSDWEDVVDATEKIYT